MRTGLAILLGIIVAFAVQAGIDVGTSYFYPYAITDMWDRRQYSEAFAARPIGALLLTVLGYFLAGLIGGWVAKRISGRRFACWVPPAVLALTAIVLAFGYPLPAWTWFAMFAAPLIGGLFANHLVADRAGLDEVPAAGTSVDASL